jgi:hypothetical protein
LCMPCSTTILNSNKTSVAEITEHNMTGFNYTL